MTLIWRPGYTWSGDIWNPNMVLNTSLWLDASDSSTITESSGLVSEWRDKSENSRVAIASTTARPTYNTTSFNGNPGISFDGVSNFLTCDSLGAIADGKDSPWSAVMAVNCATNQLSMLVTFGSNLTFTGHYVQVNPNGYLRTYRRSPGDANSYTLEGNTPVWGGNQIISLVFTGTFFTMTVNGSLYASGSLNSNDIDIDKFTIGPWRRPEAIGFGKFVTSEIIVTRGVLLDGDRQKLEGYLAHKLGLTENLPSNHPYKILIPLP